MDTEDKHSVEVLRLAEHLASLAIYDGWCEVGAGFEGRCTRKIAALRWQDGFMDFVCGRHAKTARERGALIVFPHRQGGTRRSFPPESEPV